MQYSSCLPHTYEIAVHDFNFDDAVIWRCFVINDPHSSLRISYRIRYYNTYDHQRRCRCRCSEHVIHSRTGRLIINLHSALPVIRGEKGGLDLTVRHMWASVRRKRGYREAPLVARKCSSAVFVQAKQHSYACKRKFPSTETCTMISAPCRWLAGKVGVPVVMNWSGSVTTIDADCGSILASRCMSKYCNAVFLAKILRIGSIQKAHCEHCSYIGVPRIPRPWNLFYSRQAPTCANQIVIAESSHWSERPLPPVRLLAMYMHITCPPIYQRSKLIPASQADIAVPSLLHNWSKFWAWCVMTDNGQPHQSLQGTLNPDCLRQRHLYIALRRSTISISSLQLTPMMKFFYNLMIE